MEMNAREFAQGVVLLLVSGRLKVGEVRSK
jgi:hypothetical protein